jgi:two-component system sensor histidine kinase PilS (NtrC family)
VDRLNVLVEDFLAYARPRPLRLGPINLIQIIEETAHLVKQDEMFKSEYDIVLNFSEQVLTITADEDSLRQIFWNLFRNAVEAMGDSGTLTVSAMTLYAGNKTEPFVEILIEDTGDGFSTDALNHLFEPFFTTKQGGTGLGLATVHRIVESHSGMILAENSHSGGATFRVMMPVEPREIV